MDTTSEAVSPPVSLSISEEDTSAKNPFTAITDNNHNGVDVAGLEQQAYENQMKALADMQEARANIANAQAQTGNDGGGENSAGTGHYDMLSGMNISEQGNQPSPDVLPPTAKHQKIGVWEKIISKLENSGIIPKVTDTTLEKVGKVVLLPINIPKQIIKAAWTGFKNWYAPPQTAQS